MDGAGSMIAEADRALVAWLEGIGIEAGISLEAPSEPAPGGEPRLHLYLLGFANARAARVTNPTPTQLGLRYLVTMVGGTAEQSHAALGGAVFAALERNDLEVDLDPVPLELWTGLAIAPRPAFRSARARRP